MSLKIVFHFNDSNLKGNQMNKGVKYLTEGMIAAFVLAPRVPVQAIKPVEIEQRPVGNAANHWEAVGRRMTLGTQEISNDLNINPLKLNSI